MSKMKTFTCSFPSNCMLRSGMAKSIHACVCLCIQTQEQSYAKAYPNTEKSSSVWDATEKETKTEL